jgi:hypothetical protein
MRDKKLTNGLHRSCALYRLYVFILHGGSELFPYLMIEYFVNQNNKFQDRNIYFFQNKK